MRDVARSMATLFQMMTMDSWMSGVTRPLGDHYFGAWFFCIIFVIIFSLGLLNLLTAIFIEALAALTKENAIAEAKEKAEQKKKLMVFVKETFAKYDVDNSGSLDDREIMVAMRDFDTPEYIEATLLAVCFLSPIPCVRF